MRFSVDLARGPTIERELYRGRSVEFDVLPSGMMRVFRAEELEGRFERAHGRHRVADVEPPVGYACFRADAKAAAIGGANLDSQQMNPSLYCALTIENSLEVEHVQMMEQLADGPDEK